MSKETAVLIYATYLGIDLDEENELIIIAERALNDLPKDWILEIGDSDSEHPNIPYFFNTASEESSWTHPKEEIYFQIVKDERKKMKSKKNKDSTKQKSRSINDLKFTENKSNELEIQDFDEDVIPKSNNKTTTNKSQESNLKEPSRGFGLDESDFVFNDFEVIPLKSPDHEEKYTKKKETYSSKDYSSNSNQQEKSPYNSSVINNTKPLSSWGTKDSSALSYDGKDNLKLKSDQEYERTSTSTRDREKDRRKEKSYQSEYDGGISSKYKSSSSRSESRGKDRQKQEDVWDQPKNSRSSTENLLLEEIKSLTSINKDLEISIHDIRTSYETKFQTLRASVSSAEQRIETEKSLRRDAEDKLSRIKIDYDVDYDSKLRESIKKCRLDIEEEWKDRMRGVERRLLEELENTKMELSQSRRRTEEAERDAEISRKKLSSVRDDSVRDLMMDYENSQRAQVELQDLCKHQKEEIKKLRDDHVNLSERIASSLLQLQVSASDCEAAKMDAKLAISDNQTIHTALVQATQRLHDADIETMKLRSELAMIKQELDTKTVNIMKLESVKISSGEQISLSELEIRKMKSRYETELSRLSSKVTELDVMNNILRDQISKSEMNDKAANREMEIIIEKKEFDLNRYRDRLNEYESRIELQNNRIMALEKDLAVSHDNVFSKEMAVKEEERRSQLNASRKDEVCKKLESEINLFREKLQDEQFKISQMEAKHKEEIQSIRQEVETNIPIIADAAAEKVERAWSKRLQVEVGSIKLRYEAEIESLKKEILEMNSSYAEKDARRRVQLAEDKAELASLRKLCMNLKHHMNPQSEMYYDEPDENNFNRSNVNVPSGLNSEEKKQSFQDVGGNNIFPSVFAGYGYQTERKMKSTTQLPDSSYGRPPSSASAATGGIPVSIDGRKGSGGGSGGSGQTREMQLQMQEAVNTAAFNMLQSQLTSMQYKLSASLQINTPQISPYFSVNSYSTQIKSTKSYQTESAQTESDVYKEAEATNQLFTSPQPINANVSRSIYGKESKNTMDDISSSFISVSNTEQRMNTSSRLHADASMIHEVSLSQQNRLDMLNLSDKMDLTTSKSSHSIIDNLNTEISLHDGGYHKGYWKAKYLSEDNLNKTSTSSYLKNSYSYR